MRWLSALSGLNPYRLPYSHIGRHGIVIVLALSATLTLSAVSPLPAQSTPATDRRPFTDIHRDLALGQSLLDNNDARAEPLLRTLAQQSLDALNALVGSDVISTPAPFSNPDGVVAAATRQTAQAHYLWGVAADRASQRDIAITALARATRLAGNPQNGTNLLARESLFLLSGILRDGLPLVASEDVLDTIARTVHGNLWQPRKFRFELPSAINSPSLTASGESRSTPAAREFLLTSGRLFPPLDTSVLSPVTQVFTDHGTLARIPPLYRAVAPEALPRVLKLDKMVIGYERETEGTNRGLWRQVVRVYYPSTYLTRNERDDRPRAEALCAQFLKVHAMMQTGLGLGNPYAVDGVTSIWLSEVSAWWPKDDEDPAIQTALGLLMPQPNTSQPGEEREVESTPLLRPWYAAGQVDSAPGEIMFFKMTEPREESEWLREIVHEYGHVALPAIGGFKPPLEPYGNGEAGEALGMVWAVSAVSGSLPNPSTPVVGANAADELHAGVEAHVARVAIPALRFWNAQGPTSPLGRDGTSKGLDYLKGLVLYVERVYGAPILGVACKPLVAQSVAAPDSQAKLQALSTLSLLNSLPAALRDPFAPGAKSFPIWLPGALEFASRAFSPDELSTRAPLRLRAGEKATAWLYVPVTASALTVTWKSVQASPAAGLRVEGDWKVLPASRSAGVDGALRLSVASRSGWQRFTFVPASDIIIQSASFER